MSSGTGTIYQFTPTIANPAFDKYFVEVTPKTNKVYRIAGEGQKLSDAEEMELRKTLREKYRSTSDTAGTVEITQGKRNIKLYGTYSGREWRFGKEVLINERTHIHYTDEGLVDLAIKEAAEIKFNDKSGL